MTKATISATDFLRAVVGDAEPFEVAGVGTVVIRPLTFAEAERITSANKNQTAEMMLQALAIGLVEPALTAEQIDALHAAKAGPVMKIAGRIMQISGMSEANEGEAGGGS